MTVIAANRLAAVDYKAPRLPVARGLMDVVDWPEGGLPRWFDSGVLVERTNFDGDTGYGLWNPDWNATLAEVISANVKKTGSRPDRDDTPFVHKTAYAYAKNPCGDLRSETRDETTERSRAMLERRMPKTISTAFAQRMLSDVTADSVAVGTAADVVEAISDLELALADVGVDGALIHASPKFAAPLVASWVLRLSGPSYVTPLGHTMVFSGGFNQVLDQTLIATTAVVGWKTPALELGIIEYQDNQYVSIHEQSVLLAYEQVLAAATIS